MNNIKATHLTDDTFESDYGIIYLHDSVEEIICYVADRFYLPYLFLHWHRIYDE